MPSNSPKPCINSQMALNVSGNKVVLLNNGSYPASINYLNETWTWNGTTWTNANGVTMFDPSGPLPLRTDMAMSYDGYGNILMFGGRAESLTAGVLNDSWSYSTGGTWTKLTPATVPTSRYKAQMSFLNGVGNVMFGGTSLTILYNETWIYNHSTLNWTLQSPVASPPARTDHCMAASATQVIVFGGSGTNSFLNDTWSYNGTNWSILAPATSPSVRGDAAMVYDTTNNLWVMFGGKNNNSYLAETWTFNGTTWTQRSIGAGPSGRIAPQMSFDNNTNTTIMFGGTSATTNAVVNDTWSFNGSTFTWTQL
jgi:hypothetical protein